jgi:sn-glycerol 3-phosphate transport system ATP-binding protein
MFVTKSIYEVIYVSIVLENVSKRFDNDPETLTDISAEIQTGEFFVIVGPSGSGKSTLLRMIAGLGSISGGEIKINGRVVNDLAPKDRKLSMVFQSYALYPFLNVWNNVAFGLNARKIAKVDINDRVAKALDMVGLTEFKDRKPRELSGGQRQRVALARAVADDSNICLMDEPLSNLDAQLRIKMRQEIYNLQRKLGLTLIYVTHDQVEAMTMADHIMVLNDRLVQQIGTPSEIYQEPANEFVAQFFGTPQINLLPAVKTAGSQTSLDITADFALNLNQSIPATEVKVGIRPNDLTITDSSELNANAVVDNIEYLGDETIVYATLNSGSAVRVLVAGQANFRSYQPVQIGANGKVMLFDSKGQRLHLAKEAMSYA